jgi:hypothetical protein
MKVNVILFLFFFCYFKSISQDDFRSEIKFVKYEVDAGKTYFEVVGYGFMHLTAEKDAMENLFSTIFFRGISGSPSLKPLIGLNENEIVSSNKAYFQTFFEKKRFLTFINEKECNILSGRGKRRKLKCLISVDIQILREDLKVNKIISDYGF